MTWEIKTDGTYVNHNKASDITISDLGLECNPFIQMTIGNKEDARYVGGFNLFGKTFGNYEQDILMELEYR